MPWGDRKSGHVCFLHGAGGGAWEWRAWARLFLAAGHEVRAPDLRPAAAGLARTTLADYRDQVLAWAAPGSAVLAGASLGGWLALAVSAQVRPAARILVNPVPPDGIGGWPPERRDYPEIVPWGSRPDFPATRASLPDGDYHAQRLAHENWRDESGAVMRALQAGAPAEAFDAPTLVIASGDDSEVPASVSRALAGSLGADFVLLPGASHLGPLLGDSAVGAATMALDWLENVFPERTRPDRPESA